MTSMPVTAANNLLAAAIETRMFHEYYPEGWSFVPSAWCLTKKGKREFAPGHASDV